MKVGLGGGCHWCTEAVFLSLNGVAEVEQGWISSSPPNAGLSEAILVHFDEGQISLLTLIEIHLRTHSSTNSHSMRDKYRSAVYIFDEPQRHAAQRAIEQLQAEFEQPIVTQVLPFDAFKGNDESYQNYYYKKPDKPFCRTYVDKKLRVLLKDFSASVDTLAIEQALRLP